MSRIHGVRKAVLAGFVALGLSCTAFAQTSPAATSLGQAWPNATDVSASPHWHVYVFQLNGIKYVQVNDLNGTLHAAMGATGGTAFVLPMGVDAQNVATCTGQADCSGPGITHAETVYHDAATTITATPQASGATIFMMESCPQLNCSGPGITSAIP